MTTTNMTVQYLSKLLAASFVLHREALKLLDHPAVHNVFKGDQELHSNLKDIIFAHQVAVAHADKFPM